MTLLEEIQNAAVDSNSDLGTLLRKCKLLAARLGSKPLEDWLVWESNGYPDKVKVPDYRVWSLLRGALRQVVNNGLVQGRTTARTRGESASEHIKREEQY